MSDRLVVVVLGNRNSGKSTTWNRLFDSTVRTGKKLRPLYLNRAQWTNVFVISGSSEEREKDVESILPAHLPRIVLCSAQYRGDVVETFEYFFANGYDIFVQWLNPGHHDAKKNPDTLKLCDTLLSKGATLQKRDGRADPTNRVREIRQFILGWATYRGLTHTDFAQ